MKILLKDPMTRRGVVLILVSVLMLAWNMALASRRKYYSGTLARATIENLVLRVPAPGKVEPKVQEILRSELDGPRQGLFVKEGDPVKNGQLLMEISDERVRADLATKKIALKNAETEYIKARRELDLERRLFRQLAVPKREVENAAQSLERSRQSFDAAKEEYKRIANKMKATRITSPMDGIVLKIMIENERWITEGKELMKVATMDKFTVRGRVDELDIAQVSIGQKAEVVCDAFPDRKIEGTVGWIGAQAADGAFAEIEVTIDLLNISDINLKPNLTCEASIVTGQLPQALVVPAQSLRQGEGGAFVLKALKGGWLKNQPVKVSRMSGQQAVISEGLKAGETILVPKDEE